MQALRVLRMQNNEVLHAAVKSFSFPLEEVKGAQELAMEIQGGINILEAAKKRRKAA